MLANKSYKGGIFVNCLHFCCTIIYYSHSLFPPLVGNTDTNLEILDPALLFSKTQNVKSQKLHMHLQLLYFCYMLRNIQQSRAFIVP